MEVINSLFVYCTTKNSIHVKNFFKQFKENIPSDSLNVNFTPGYYYGFNNYEFTSIHHSHISNYIAGALSFCSLSKAKDIVKARSNNNDIIEDPVFEELTFPRPMWVKDKHDNIDMYRTYMVIAYARNKYICWAYYNTDITEREDLDYINDHRTVSFDEAVEIDYFKVISREEIASLVNTTPDRLRIID